MRSEYPARWAISLTGTPRDRFRSHSVSLGDNDPAPRILGRFEGQVTLAGV